ncbi:hypothetical protein [Muricoccus vinaceus]|uniref:SAV-6107-like HEPN domain-containing protein n=1 Tax=Muricoccus vinaceus TaxID=424704 RepID=A0ABV6IUI9_9PROT
MPRKRVSTPSSAQRREDPNTGNDPVLALYWNYFSVARRAFEMVEEAERATRNAKASEREVPFARYQAFLPMWLAALFTTCEGFRAIGGKRPALEAQMDEIMEPLRTVWRHTVNYHDDATQKQGRAPFYERSVGLLQKAADLHNALIAFFHDHVVALSRQAASDNHKH